jgi:hypothetical protein
MSIAIEEVSAAIAPPPPEQPEPVVATASAPLDVEAVLRLIRRERSRAERRCAN